MRNLLGRLRRSGSRSLVEQLATLTSVGDGSTLTLDFTTGVLDPRLTFDRTSLGTYVGPDGYLYGADSSTSSQTIGSSGTKTFTLSATAGLNRRYGVGDTVIASSGANNMSGTVTSYDSSTQVLSFTASSSTGSGTFTSWIIGTRMARFDHDPTTGSPRGLLIEGSATNLCLNGSMAYTATAPTNWVRGFSGCTVASVDSTTFPGQKAWSISATASGQRDLLEQVISLAANTTYTVSVYLEAVTGTTATFAYMTSLPAGATSATVVNPSAGRVSFTVTVGATAGNGTLRLGIGSATGTGVSADASVRFSHVQVEAGSGASSYIPTGASTGTRNQDQMQMTDLASIGFNTSAGTLTINGTYNKDANSAAYPRSIRFMGTSVQSMAMITSGKTLFGNTPNTSGGSYFEASRTLASAGAFKFGWTLTTAVNPALASATVSLNGSSTSITPLGQGAIVNPISLDFLYPSGSALNFPSMNISSLKYWPYATTAAELNVRTSL